MDYIYDFGLNISIAFQLQDDILDCWSNLEDFGKVTGTDIADNKKTFLYLKALETGTKEEREELLYLYSNPVETQTKQERVKAIYEKLNIRSISKDLMNIYNEKAKYSLEKIAVKDDRQILLNLQIS